MILAGVRSRLHRDLREPEVGSPFVVGVREIGQRMEISAEKLERLCPVHLDPARSGPSRFVRSASSCRRSLAITPPAQIMVFAASTITSRSPCLNVTRDRVDVRHHQRL